ncbi:hypothetical protein [Bacillus sp. 2205SS5-2]|uniref:hypothetical protein n=1 Tax=Bacillus sp. 2205SS5-2 TaxID=3109031 RepID=UPI0030052D0D
MLTLLAFYVSFSTAVYLFSFSYIEALKIFSSSEKVYGGTFIFATTMALVFSTACTWFV